MIATIEVERFSLISSRPSDKILAAIKAAIGHPDIVAFAKRTAAAPTFPEFESVVREGLGKTDLMLFMELDHGAVTRKATDRDKPRMVRLIVGNPLIMKEMVFRMPAPMRRLPCLWMSAPMASICHVTEWQAS
jgi:hypothetical protein